MTQTSKRMKFFLAVGILLASGKVQAQSRAFYTNTDTSTTASTPIIGASPGSEVIDDIPFTGTYRVDRFVIGYNIPRRTPVANRNLTVSFYQPNPGTANPLNVLAPTTPVFQIALSNANAGGFDTEDIDLAAMGKSFEWTAGTTFGGEQGGYLGLLFDRSLNNNAYLADGGGSSSILEIRNSSIPGDDALYEFYFGPGVPLEGSIYAVVYGTAVPEPSVSALLLGLSISGARFLVKRRKNARKAA